MKLLSFITAGIMFILLSCEAQKISTGNQEKLYDRKWSLKRIFSSNGIKEVNNRAFIRFNKARQSAAGNGSCNSFGSTAIVASEKISFTGIFSTKMYCEGVQDVENNFLMNLAKVTRYNIKADSLYLFNDNDLLLIFKSE